MLIDELCDDRILRARVRVHVRVVPFGELGRVRLFEARLFERVVAERARAVVRLRQVEMGLLLGVLLVQERVHPLRECCTLCAGV